MAHNLQHLYTVTGKNHELTDTSDSYNIDQLPMDIVEIDWCCLT